MLCESGELLVHSLARPGGCAVLCLSGNTGNGLWSIAWTLVPWQSLAVTISVSPCSHHGKTSKIKCLSFRFLWTPSVVMSSTELDTIFRWCSAWSWCFSPPWYLRAGTAIRSSSWQDPSRELDLHLRTLEVYPWLRIGKLKLFQPTSLQNDVF